MANEKEKDWSEIYDTITNYNEWNNTRLSNIRIREDTNKKILEEQSEANNVTVDMLSPQRNKTEDLIDKVENLVINNIGNYLIEKFATSTINYTGNNLINKVTSLTISDVRNHLNRSNGSDTQVQFAGDSAGIFHQNLFSRRMISIGYKEVPVVVP